MLYRPMLCLAIALTGWMARAEEKPATPQGAAPGKGQGGQAVSEPIPKTTLAVEMVRIPGGKVTIKGPDGAEKTIEVKPFLMQKTECAWEYWDVMYLSLDLPPAQRDTEGKKRLDALLKPSPKPYLPPDYGWGHNGMPIMSINVGAVQTYIDFLNKLTGKKYRLPTEAEWEYACRAGADKPARPSVEELKDVAWFANNADEHTQPCGQKPPNPWGLHDMLGNVSEWVVREDQSAVAAGGSFQDEADGVGSDRRETPSVEKWQKRDCQDPKSKIWLSDAPHVGFRLVRDLEPGEK